MTNLLRRSPLVAALALMLALAWAVTAQARKPIVAYFDANSQFALYDTQTDQALPSPIPANDVKSFGVSQDGRYYAYFDKAGKLHLFDSTAKAQVALPGTENASGGYPTVSNTGVIAWDANANGPTTVYDSRSTAFVDVGFAPDPNVPNSQRMPEFSGDGRFLATNCLATCIGTKDDDGGTATYVQDVGAKKDTGFPINLTKGDEHTCINGDGSVVGMDVTMANSMKHGIFLYDRAKGAAVDVSAINDPNLDQRYCVLDAGAQYVGLSSDDGTTNRFRLYDLSAKQFVNLPITIPGTNQGSVALIQPPPPPPPPAPTTTTGGGSNGASTTGASGKTAAKLSALSVTVRSFRPRGVGRGRGTTLRFKLSTAARVKVQLGRTVRRGGRKTFKTLRTYSVKGRKGFNTLRIDGRVHSKPLAPGAYTLRIEVGGKTRSIAIRIRGV